jgi:hypothetical protein
MLFLTHYLEMQGDGTTKKRYIDSIPEELMEFYEWCWDRYQVLLKEKNLPFMQLEGRDFEGAERQALNEGLSKFFVLKKTINGDLVG